MTKYPKTVATLLWIDDKVALAKRLKTKTFSGYYESTGGKVEDTDRSIVVAAQREIIEETGITIPTWELTLIDCIINCPTTLKCFLFAWNARSRLGLSQFKNIEKSKRTHWKLYTVEEARQLKLMPGLKENLILPT